MYIGSFAIYFSPGHYPITGLKSIALHALLTTNMRYRGGIRVPSRGTEKQIPKTDILLHIYIYIYMFNIIISIIAALFTLSICSNNTEF